MNSSLSWWPRWWCGSHSPTLLSSLYRSDQTLCYSEHCRGTRKGWEECEDHELNGAKPPCKGLFFSTSDIRFLEVMKRSWKMVPLVKMLSHHEGSFIMPWIRYCLVDVSLYSIGIFWNGRLDLVKGSLVICAVVQACMYNCKSLLNKRLDRVVLLWPQPISTCC